jgi:hypothetical protein
MIDEEKYGQSGGVNIGGNVSAGGDIVGRDKISVDNISRAQIDQAFGPLAQAVSGHQEATQKLEELKNETAKGDKANDGIVAKLVEGLVALVPGAVGAILSAFGSPILGGIAGPATKYVLGKLRGE